MRISLRGDLQVNDHLIPPDSRKGLLYAYLANCKDHRSGRDKVAADLWPDQSKDAQLNSLRQSLFISKRIGGVVSDRAYVWLDQAETDLEKFGEWREILPDWSHSWIQSMREADRQAYTDRKLTQVDIIQDPIAKVEFLKEALEANPLDEDLNAQLLNLYQDLNWRSEFALHIRALDRRLRSSDQFLSAINFLEFTRLPKDDSIQNRFGLSQSQNVAYTIARFPILFTTGSLIEAIDLLESTIIEGNLQPHEESQIGYFLMRSYLLTGQVDHSMELIQRFSGKSRTDFDVLLRAHEFFNRYQYHEVLKLLKREMARVPFSDELYCDAMALLSTCAKLDFDLESSISYAEAGLERASEIGYRHSHLYFQWQMLWLKRDADGSSIDLKDYEALIEIAEKYGFRLMRSTILTAKGKALRELGQFREAECLLKECIGECDQFQYGRGLCIALDYLGENYISLKQFEDAALSFQRSALLRRESGEKVAISTSYRGAGLALLGIGDFEMSAKFLKRSLSIYRNMGHKMVFGVCCIYLSLAHREVDASEAKRAWKAGISALIETKASHSEIRYEMGEWAWSLVKKEIISQVPA